MQIDKLTQIDPIYCHLNIYKSKVILNIYFESNYVFTSYPDCILTYQVDQVTSDQFSYDLNFFH